MDIFFTMSGYALWLILAIIFFVEVALLSFDEEESNKWAVGIGVVSFILAYFFTDLFHGVTWDWLVASVVLYLVAGTLWSFKKWYSFVVEKREYYWALWVRDNDTGKKSWLEYSAMFQPLASQNKNRIIAWMTLWPFSFSWWILTWPRHVFTWIYQRLTTIYDRMARKIFSVEGP